MNIIEKRVEQWLKEHEIQYTKHTNFFVTPLYNIVCVPFNNDREVFKQRSTRLVFEHNIEKGLKDLQHWENKKPTKRIEKLIIDTRVDQNVITINSTFNNEKAASCVFWIEKDIVFWATLEYHNFFVPGWISKCLKIVERLKLGKRIECATNAIDSSFLNLGFKVIEKTDSAWYSKKMNLPNPYMKPEKIIIWRLTYDCISTV